MLARDQSENEQNNEWTDALLAKITAINNVDTLDPDDPKHIEWTGR